MGEVDERALTPPAPAPAAPPHGRSERIGCPNLSDNYAHDPNASFSNRYYHSDPLPQAAPI